MKPSKNIEWNCRISDAANTWNYAFHILESNGFKIFRIPNEEKDSYIAIHNEKKVDFMAEDALSLLGLFMIWEKFGNDWQYQETNGDLDLKILYKTYPEKNDYDKLSDAAFKDLVADYQLFLSRLYVSDKIKIDDNISKDELFNIISNLKHTLGDIYDEWFN